MYVGQFGTNIIRICSLSTVGFNQVCTFAEIKFSVYLLSYHESSSFKVVSGCAKL